MSSGVSAGGVLPSLRLHVGCCVSKPRTSSGKLFSPPVDSSGGLPGCPGVPGGLTGVLLSCLVLLVACLVVHFCLSGAPGAPGGLFCGPGVWCWLLLWWYFCFDGLSAALAVLVPCQVVLVSWSAGPDGLSGGADN